MADENILARLIFAAKQKMIQFSKNVEYGEQVTKESVEEVSRKIAENQSEEMARALSTFFDLTIERKIARLENRVDELTRAIASIQPGVITIRQTPTTISSFEGLIPSLDLNPASSDTLVESGVVLSLADDSGNGLAATQAIPADRPTYNASDADFGGKPSISFDGISDRLATPSYQIGNGGSAVTMYIVFKSSTLGGFDVIYGANGGVDSAARVTLNGNFFNVTYANPNGSNTVKNPAATSDTIYRVAACFDCSTGSDAIPRLLINGAEVISYASTTALDNTEFATSQFGVGADPDSAFGYFNGKIARILTYDGAHTLTQMQEIDFELATVYGL